jgi:hypothetical protein
MPILGDARDRELAGHRPGGHHQNVVRKGKALAHGWLHQNRTVGMVDLRHAAVDQPGLLQVPPQRDRRVARLDRAGHHLGQEGLIGHVRARIDHDDLRLVPAEFLLQFPGRVEAGVATTDHQDRPHRALCFSRLRRGDELVVSKTSEGGDS